MLERSPTARGARADFAALMAPAVHGPLLFRARAGQSDGAIPDLVGERAAGSQPLVIEATFWAGGLTERQPVEYLARLPAEGGLLLFIAPGKRFETLWPELLRRAAAVGRPYTPSQAADGARVVALAGGASLGLASWDAVLQRLIHAVQAAGERDAAADLAQLAGLCSAEDVYAFRPVSSAELTGDLGEQIVQWCRIVDDVVAKAKGEKLFDQRATRAPGGDGDWGHYVRLGGAGLYLHFSPYKWGRVRATPLWLRIYTTRGGEWRSGVEL